MAISAQLRWSQRAIFMRKTFISSQNWAPLRSMNLIFLAPSSRAAWSRVISLLCSVHCL